jgi:outer membrane protein OmpA-like peptidoglycan-associated protein
MIRPVFLTLLCALAAGPVVAATDGASGSSTDSGTAENTGILGGIAVGASVGGPPGAVAGAAIGALLGNGWKARRQVDELQVHVADLRQQAETLQQQKAQLELALRDAIGLRDRTVAANYEQPLSGCCDNTVVSVYFRTGSDAVEAHDREVLASFARLTSHMADPLIEITGYADRNGDAEANLKLSQRRSLQVSNLLADMGADNTKVTTVAYGETRPLSQEPTFETDFFDRRVILRLRDASQLMLSRNQDPVQ